MNFHHGPKSLRHRTLEAEFSERSYLQWVLIRSIAFAERDWMLMTAILFWGDKTREFMTVPGILFFLLGLFSVGPIGGVFIYFTNKLVYQHLKKRKAIPKSIREMKRMSWCCNIFWFPVMFAAGIGYYRLFFQLWESMRVF